MKLFCMMNFSGLMKFRFVPGACSSTFFLFSGDSVAIALGPSCWIVDDSLLFMYSLL